MFQARLKHIEIQHHFIHVQVEQGENGFNFQVHQHKSAIN